MAQKYAHSIESEGVDVEMAVALGRPVTATCGLVFTPTLYGAETRSRAECPECYPPKKTRATRGPKLKNSKGLPHYVYRCYDESDRLIYVGASVSPRTRMEQHKATSWWFDQVVRVRFVVFADREYALNMERRAIVDENPRWNIQGRDKSLWNAEDYRDFHTSLTRAGASEARIHKLRLEALRRLNFDLTESA